MRNIKIIYENDRGESVVISNTFPYLLKSFTGGDGAEANITSSKGVGQDGSTIINVNLKERPLQIIGIIKDMDKSTLIKRKAKLLQVFNPKVQGWLQYDYGDATRRIRCQVESAPTFSMPFNVFNVLYFVVDLYPSLFNVNTREYFKINKIMEAGEVITVTTHFQNKRVELNKNGVISNAFNWIDFTSTFLQLDPGDNLFRYDADEGIDSLEVDIYYNPQYLGV